MRKIILGCLFTTFLLLGCSKRNNVSFNLFDPNSALNANDIFNLASIKELQLDKAQKDSTLLIEDAGFVLDCFEFKKIIVDTTVIFLTTDKTLIYQEWRFSVSSKNSIFELSKFFEKKYGLETLKFDTIGCEGMIVADAILLKKKLRFSYSINEEYDCQYDEANNNQYVSINYIFPCYEKYIKKNLKRFNDYPFFLDFNVIQTYKIQDIE
jgi:hypothetical protein